MALYSLTQFISVLILYTVSKAELQAQSCARPREEMCGVGPNPGSATFQL